MIHLLFAFYVAIFAQINAQTTTNEQTNETTTNEQTNEMTIQYEYYEYKNIRDATNNFFNLRVTYDTCDAINNNDNSRYACKQHAYERAITIDA